MTTQYLPAPPPQLKEGMPTYLNNELLRISQAIDAAASGAGLVGATGATGGTGPAGTNGVDGASPTIDWWHYIGNTKYQDVTTVVAAGDVLEYVYGPTTTTVYRYITTALTGLYPTEDAYYSNFNGTLVSGLIVGR